MIIEILLAVIFQIYACVSLFGMLGFFWLLFHVLRGNSEAYLARSPKTRFVVRNWKPCLFGYMAVGVAIGPVQRWHVYVLIGTLVFWAMLIVHRWVIDTHSDDDDELSG